MALEVAEERISEEFKRDAVRMVFEKGYRFNAAAYLCDYRRLVGIPANFAYGYSTFATAATKTVFRGVEFAPVPEPGGAMSLVASAAAQ